MDAQEVFRFYQGKRVFLTGHTGFKGTWLCQMLLQAGAEVTGYALEPPTDPSLFAITGMRKKIRSVTGDVRDQETLLHAMREARPEVVFHLAAQPIVRESYRSPAYTYETNVMGTVHLLEAVRRCDTVRSVLNVTTDKVYENREWAWGYRESDPLDGYDPYSNSKSCSELVTHSYRRSFFTDAAGRETVPVSTARAGNVIGGGDFAADRIIPDCVRAVSRGETIAVRNPYSTRPYQHVLEPLYCYLMIAAAQARQAEMLCGSAEVRSGTQAETFCGSAAARSGAQESCSGAAGHSGISLAGAYNVGPDDCDCVTTGELVELFCRCYGEGARWESRAEQGAPHEASFLKLDCSLIKSVFGWQPRWHIQECMERVCEWSRVYLEGGDCSAVMERQIGEFRSLA
ncbi:MAG: CDP-glucose 4,6-dehydratase [Eubacteriales bacterium]|nr:CDP-glucose 4,6-dehydratase [Eubacteriales bacterium]